MRKPFLNCNANSNDLLLLKKKMTGLAQKPDKNGCASLAGDGFAKALAEYWEVNYVNDKAPFDVFFDDANCVRGVEVKLKNYNPYKETKTFANQLYIELSNGTSNAWTFIEACTGKSRFSLGAIDDSLANILGNAYIQYCWNRFSYREDLRLDQSLFVVGHLYKDQNKDEQCQIFTLPLNKFPSAGSLNWKFSGKKNASIVGMRAGQRVLSWYWIDNGLGKFHPKISDCMFVSEPFQTDTDKTDRFIAHCRRMGVSAYMRHIVEQHKTGKMSKSHFNYAFGVGMRDKNFPDHYLSATGNDFQ